MNPDRLIIGRHRGEPGRVAEPDEGVLAHLEHLERSAENDSRAITADFVAGFRHALNMGFVVTDSKSSPPDWHLEILVGLETLPNAAAIVLALRKCAAANGLTVQELLG